jgi:ABC-type Zn uptake system ZnuABC Zn-binding protein ZnuA
MHVSLPAWRRRATGWLATTVLWLSVLASAEAQPLVVTTTPDLKSIVEAVAGGSVRVESLVPPGADPEAFEPRPSHVSLVREASLVARIGLGYDEWLNPLLKQSQNAALQPGGSHHLDLSTAVALLEVQGRSVEARSGHAHGAANPHYWLDPVNVEILSAQIAEALTRIAPDDASVIAAAQKHYADALRAGIERWSGALREFRGASVIAYHNSWPYFARRFRLNILDVIEAKEGVPPSPARLLALVQRMRAEKVRAILHEAFEPLASSNFLAQRTGARVVVMAPSVGAKAEAGDLIALFDHNTAMLVQALTSGP